MGKYAINRYLNRIVAMGWAHRKMVLPTVVVAGLIIATTCGAPDEVRRVSSAQLVGGSSAGVSGSSGTGSAGQTGSTTSSQSAAGSTNPFSSAGAGGNSSVGGSGGTSSRTGGLSSSGGKGGGGSSTSTRTGGSGGTSVGTTGSSYPPIGGSGGSRSTGGTTGLPTGGTGGSAGGSTGSSTGAPPPENGLGVYVTQKITGGPGQIAYSLRIENRSAQTIDMSTVTLRYWYQDEGLGTSLVMVANYVSIGYSNLGKVTDGKAVAVSPAKAGADHYIELSFSGTLAAKGDSKTNDQFTANVTMHTASYQGAVDLTNDYSYSDGATGYNDKITLHDNSGKVIWGTVPGTGAAVTTPDAGVDVRVRGG